MIKLDKRVKIVGLTVIIAASTAVFGMEITGVHALQPAVVIPASKSTSTAAMVVDVNLPMPQLLKVLAKANPPVNYFNTERADVLAGRVAVEKKFRPKENAEIEYASELLRAGRSEQALVEYDLISKQVLDNSKEWQPVGFADFLLMQKATAYLRIGEQQNCCASNNSDSCLIPIAGKGIHTRRYGSANAIKCLATILQHKPDDLKARWLLNIAYMTLGEYPEGVPAKWRIDPKVYGNEYPMPKFYNVAPDVGLAVNNWSGGAAMEDFTGKGFLDVMISSMRPDGQLRFFRNNGDGTFTDRTKAAGLIGECGGLNMVTTDYDNDGRPDVLILRGGWFGRAGHLPVSLLHNNGDGTFTDVTHRSGLIKHMQPSQTAVWFDYNGDGYLDVFIGNESDPTDPSPSELYRNNGDGSFTDVTALCGLNIRRFVKGVITADYDHDGRPDIYLSCGDGPNVLLHNDGPAGADKSPNAAWSFTNAAEKAGVDSQSCTFSCFFFDYDNDGWPDIYVNGFGSVDVAQIAADYLGQPSSVEKARLYRNNHNGTFTDVTKQTHLFKANLGMGVNFGDLDNDGWLDFYVGTGNPDLTTLIPKRMFRNNDGKFFQEVTTAGDFGHLQKGHAIAFGDINNSGQVDIFSELGGAYTGDTAHDCLYVNPGNGNHWVNLKLEGVKSNRSALGAETCVDVTTPHGERKVYETVGSGGSFGCNPFRQHFGLGDATSIKSVTIYWPSTGLTQTITNVKMDKFWHIREGDTAAQPVKVKTFPLPHGGAPNGSIEAKGIIVS